MKWVCSEDYRKQKLEFTINQGDEGYKFLAEQNGLFALHSV